MGIKKGVGLNFAAYKTGIVKSSGLNFAADDNGGGGIPYLLSDGNVYLFPFESLSSVQISKIEIDCAVDSSFFEVNQNGLFGYYRSSNLYGIFYNSIMGKYGYYNGNQNSPITVFTKTADRQLLTINISTEMYETSYPLFAKRSFSSNTYSPVKAKIYSAKFYDTNGDVIIDLVPKVENGVASLYDNVRELFLTVQGSGSFTYGEE